MVVPGLVEVRNVPALSKRGDPPPKRMEFWFCITNIAPASLVITPPSIAIGLAADQKTVPAFSSVRLERVTVFALEMFNVAPWAIIVLPLPLIAPVPQRHVP